ncbi:NADH-quinone oxidoreductase subunit K [bacterium]|nr:NADH-quinone oxidoreductase subunit K [bacterium]
MELIAALTVGILTALAVALFLRKSLFDVVLGAALLSQAVNLLIISMSGWKPGLKPAVLNSEKVVTDAGPISAVDPSLYVDPLPQALILTAIVIGFALLSYLMGLLARSVEDEPDLALGEHGEEAAR